MKFFLDTANLDEIRQAAALGLCDPLRLCALARGTYFNDLVSREVAKTLRSAK